MQALERRTFLAHSPEETHRLGTALGQHLLAGAVVALSGDLGAGKTTFTQGIAAGLGIHVRVTSPTFTLVNEYDIFSSRDRSLERLIHIDSYRLGDASAAAVSEAATFGLEEILDDPNAVVVIEWGERLRSILPDDHLWITLTATGSDEGSRRLVITATGSNSQAILQRL